MQLTDHSCEKASCPQPLDVFAIIVKDTKWKDDKCKYLKDDTKRHQSLDRDIPRCTANQKQSLSTVFTYLFIEYLC